MQLGERLTQPHHYAGFGHHPGRKRLGVLEQTQRALVAGAGADHAIEPRHGFGVVVENVGLGVKHDLESFIQTLKVGDQDFDPAAGSHLTNLADGFGKHARAAPIVVIAIDAGDDRMPQAESGNCFGNPRRLLPVDGPRLAFGHGAEATVAGADVAEKHKRGGAMVPALAYVGALGRFADRMQAQSTGQLF